MLFGSLLDWIGKAWRRRPHRQAAARPRSTRPWLEPLEDRLVPTVFIEPIPNQIAVENTVLEVALLGRTEVPPLGEPNVFFNIVGETHGAFINFDFEHGQFELGFVPTSDQVGQDLAFTLIGRNGANENDVAFVTFTVTVKGSRPEIESIANQTIALGQTLNLELEAIDYHNPPIPLKFSLEEAPEGALFNPETRIFTFTPTSSQSPGVFTVTLRVAQAENSDLFSEATFLITVVPPAPPLPPAPIPPLIPVNPVNVINPFADNNLITALTARASAPVLPRPATGFLDLGGINQGQVFVGVQQGKAAELPPPSSALAFPPAPNPAPFSSSLDLQVNLERATVAPLRLSNTENNTDGSSVERLHKDFFARSSAPEETTTTEEAPDQPMPPDPPTPPDQFLPPGQD